MTDPSEPASTCRHCRLPLTARGEFCCSGCFLAHHLSGDAEGRGSDRLLARLAVSAFLSMGVMVSSLSLYGMDDVVVEDTGRALQGLVRLGALLLSVPVWVLLGLPLLVASWRSARRTGVRAGTETLIILGVAAAVLVSLWNTYFEGPYVYYETAASILVLVTLGRWLDTRMRERARERLSMLAPVRLGSVIRVVEPGAEDRVRPEELAPGQLVRIQAGETLPVDGAIVNGTSFIDAAHLTGEETPRAAGPGDEVLAGTRTVDGALLVRVTAAAGNCVQDELERLLAEATTHRPALVRLADRFVRILLPLVLVIAGATLWVRTSSMGLETGLMDAMCVLLIACPCALGLATPLAFWMALGHAWKAGALVRGGDVLERLARARRVFLDKTGTLTSGSLQLVSVDAQDRAPAEALRIAAALERNSTHPIARALCTAKEIRDDTALPEVEDFRTLPGIGVEGSVDEKIFRMRSLPDHEHAGADGRTRVVLEQRGDIVATFELSAELRPEARSVVQELERRGLRPMVLTGDSNEAARWIERELEVAVSGGLLPKEKLEFLRSSRGEELEMPHGSRGTVFVGDGLNDALALGAADVGISIGDASATSLESAQINLLRDDLRLVPGLIDLARRAVTTATGNLVWAFAYNGVGLWLAATGRLTPIFAASAMVASSLVVLLTSVRAAPDLLSSGNPGHPGRPGDSPGRPGAAPRSVLAKGH